MPFNRIAVYGHRGWASSAIVKALANSGAPIRVLHRPGSDTSALPANVEIVEVDLSDQASLVSKLDGIDIVICLVGHNGVSLQHHFVEAIPKTQVKLFVPSDLSARYDALGNRIPVNRNKLEVEKMARQAGIPTTVVLPGNFAEFILSTQALGVDIENNEILFMGNSASDPINLCTRRYVAAAYADIFSCTAPSQLENRDLALSELTATGTEIAEFLQQIFNITPLTKLEPIEKVIRRTEEAVEEGNPFALALYCRKIWATGEQAKMIGEDTWHVKNYQKATFANLFLEGKLEPYRELPTEVELSSTITDVDIVDIKANRITEITQKVIRSQDGTEWELDALVFATGFDAVDGNYKRMSILGASQKTLADSWSEGPESYLGMSVPGFPNLFMILGPNGPFTNLPPTIETQVEFISDMILKAEQSVSASKKPPVVEVDPMAIENWSKICDELSAHSLFRKTDSWIFGANVAGKKPSVLFFFGGLANYRKVLQEVIERGNKEFKPF